MSSVAAGQWVDFKAVKAAVSFSQVLSRYGIDWLRVQGDEQRGRCPFNGCPSKDGFHVNAGKGAFQCFQCKRRGNVLDFVAAMESSTVRDAALKLADWFAVDGNQGQVQPPAAKEEPMEPTIIEPTPAAVNQPLTFQLKGIDPAHSYLAGRGIAKELAEQFGIGFFSGRGSMSGRVVIPIHNERGELVAYAGRTIDNGEPKYKLPAGFHKSLELYNLHRAVVRSREVVVVVEGYFGCIRLWRAGFPSVALMGSSMSEEQEQLLVRAFPRCWLMLDGDEAGRNGMADILPRLAKSLWVRQVGLPEGKQPDQLDVAALQAVLT